MPAHSSRTDKDLQQHEVNRHQGSTTFSQVYNGGPLKRESAKKRGYFVANSWKRTGCAQLLERGARKKCSKEVLEQSCACPKKRSIAWTAPKKRHDDKPPLQWRPINQHTLMEALSCQERVDELNEIKVLKDLSRQIWTYPKHGSFRAKWIWKSWLGFGHRKERSETTRKEDLTWCWYPERIIVAIVA